MQKPPSNLILREKVMQRYESRAGKIAITQETFKTLEWALCSKTAPW